MSRVNHIRSDTPQRAADLRSRNPDWNDLSSTLRLRDQSQVDGLLPDSATLARPAPVQARHVVVHRHAPPQAHVSEDSPHGSQTPPRAHPRHCCSAMCQECSDAILVQRQERTRARNRAAQARYRLKIKARALFRHHRHHIIVHSAKRRFLAPQCTRKMHSETCMSRLSDDHGCVQTLVWLEGSSSGWLVSCGCARSTPTCDVKRQLSQCRNEAKQGGSLSFQMCTSTLRLLLCPSD